tara:strand:+ start:2742 stop:2945 length:204 start_codon:yes stop_codon:yes gene_type:complete
MTKQEVKAARLENDDIRDTAVFIARMNRMSPSSRGGYARTRAIIQAARRVHLIEDARINAARARTVG